MKTYTIGYYVNLMHEIDIEANSVEEAEAIFEDRYANDHDSLPDYFDITHTIDTIRIRG